ncbi:transglycosylase domain-containing protein [Qipengyuania sp. JC766]|uniref:penicillin-binding protein 1A n=1 Tax=Qipengyuania sp. JC766 TaxID=3232139 RepID=UPI003457CE9C
MAESTLSSVTYRVKRGAGGAAGWLASVWRERRLFRWATYLLAVMLAFLLAGYIAVTRDLPDAEALLDYQPSLPTTVRGVDGEIVHSYARERRVQLQFDDFPEPLINAFLAAEDKTFFSHGGIDAGGLVGAVTDYVSKMGSDERAVGGSTITQQVAKNILLTNEYSITRKLREMVLARRIEGVLSKQEILELYLNEIPLGRRSYGVQAASRTYFDKDVGDLELHEAAFLATLPKAPERYSRAANFEETRGRRNFILDQMAENEFITQAEANAAKAKPLELAPFRSQVPSVDAGYFLEEVRRQLIDEFGENSEDGNNSVYGGGLWVRTSLDPEMQDAARVALREGLYRYHGSRGWTGPVATIDFDDGPWESQLASTGLGINYEGWRVGVVTQREGGSATIGFSDGETAPLSGLPNALKAGDVIVASQSGNGYRVRSLPEVGGGFVAQEPLSGRILAMQGGFDSRLEAFNRATQAKRQPGSSIKPFVYATGLDNGMTPSTLVDNSRYCYQQAGGRGQKCIRGGRGGSYPMRYGLEQSQNIMTVQIGMQSGMDNVVKTIETMGISEDVDPYAATTLGSEETTVRDIVNAYSALVNHGRLNEPTVIDYVQDRNGKVIWRADRRECDGCNMPEWDGQPMPRLGLSGKQAMDPRTAFQVVHMLEGVVQRGTATVLADLDMPMFGKTGTTTGPKDVWFVGGTRDVVTGVYLGFDEPRNMGGYAQGGTVAAPVVKRFLEQIKDRLSGEPFVAPAGVRMVRVDRATGKQVFDRWPTGEPRAAVIWEAFKPNTEPPRYTRRDELERRRKQILELLRRAQNSIRREASERAAPVQREEPPADFVEDQGGIY